MRVVAATARPLEEMIRQERFRQDLYYRINVVEIDLPPLRERGDDIGLLAEYMAVRYSREMGRDIRGITPEAYQVLAQYRWPGNVRELQNVIRRGIALAKGQHDRAGRLAGRSGRGGGRESGRPANLGYFALRDSAWRRSRSNTCASCSTATKGTSAPRPMEAKLPRGTLYRLLKKHGLESASFR